MMKRKFRAEPGRGVVLASRDPDSNPSDRAEAIVQSLGNSITQLHNIHLRAKRDYQANASDDSKMSKLADRYGDLLKEIDQLIDRYGDK